MALDQRIVGKGIATASARTYDPDPLHSSDCWGTSIVRY